MRNRKLRSLLLVACSAATWLANGREQLRANPGPAADAGLIVVATVPVGATPQGVAANSLTNRIYVANAGPDNTVSVINGATNSVIATIPVGFRPQCVGVNASTNRVYVANWSSDTVSVIDGATNHVVATVPVGAVPYGVAVNASTNRVYVTNNDEGTVSVIDGAANSVVAIVLIGSNSSPSGLAVNSSTNRIYVADATYNSVSVIDGASNEVVATVPVGDLPWHVSVNPSAQRIYATNWYGYTVSVINGATNSVVATVPVGSYPYGVAVKGSSGRIYVANYGSDTVSVIDGATNTVVAAVPVGDEPWAVAINSSTGRVYVTNSNSGTVSVMEIAYTISGYVRNASGQGIAGVVISGLPGSPSTDIAGHYGCAVPTGWSGTVTPEKTCYTFVPSSVTYTNVISDRSAQNYTGAFSCPAAPTNLTAAAVSSVRTNLSWTDNSANENGFTIERRTGAGSYTQVGAVGANVIRSADTTCQAHTTYTYRVRAWNSAGNLDYSNEATVTTPTFDDVLPTLPVWPYVEAVTRQGVAGGCSTAPPLYCPDTNVTRAQMAKFLCAAAGQDPLDRATPTFSDVPKTHWAYTYVERLADAASWGGSPPTGGCRVEGTTKYFCPNDAVTREQMAKFLCVATSRTQMPTCAGTFADVTAANAFCRFIERLADPTSWPGGVAVTGGCAAGPPRLYCPKGNVTRGQMAVFLVKAFAITL